MPSLVEAAKNLVNPLTAETPLKPVNCHEAVLGWLLISLGYPRPWRLIRQAAARPGHGVGNPLQFQGDWMWQHVYPSATRVSQATVGMARAGDILCSGTAGRPTHSMVVVERLGAAVKIRGFNNVGTFGHLRPPPGYMQYDNTDRDVADGGMWNVTGRHPNTFGPATVDLFLVRGVGASQAVARAFPWESSTFPVTTGARWHFNVIQGWRHL
jgi:hypothetical protein